jgi:predicted Zn finger-like uncharacterized protein
VIVECPRCNARYRVDDDVASDEPTFKCSRCSHFFGQEAVAVVRAAKQAKDTEADELAPPIVDDDADAAAETTLPEPTSPAFTPEPPIEPAPPPRRTPARNRADPESLALPFSARPRDESPADELEADDREFTLDVEDEPSDEYALGATDPASDARPRFIRDSEEYAPTRSRDRVGRPYLIFLGVLLLVFGNLALYLRNHPDTAERFLASVPFAGRILVENRLLQSRVYLRDIEGVYQQIKDGRTVFIVTGRAINTAEAPLKGVEIESALYDGAGSPLVAKSIYCGNAMSLKIVKDLSSKEISILQRLQPPQRFEIAPGEAAGFSVVFLDPPDGFKEFSARVTAAQPALS